MSGVPLWPQQLQLLLPAYSSWPWVNCVNLSWIFPSGDLHRRSQQSTAFPNGKSDCPNDIVDHWEIVVCGCLEYHNIYHMSVLSALALYYSSIHRDLQCHVYQRCTPMNILEILIVTFVIPVFIPLYYHTWYVCMHWTTLGFKCS